MSCLRAALAWPETLTLIWERQVPDLVFEEAGKSFSERELVNLILTVEAIHGWNRFAIAFRSQVGWYRPGMAAEMMKQVGRWQLKDGPGAAGFSNGFLRNRA